MRLAFVAEEIQGLEEKSENVSMISSFLLEQISAGMATGSFGSFGSYPAPVLVLR